MKKLLLLFLTSSVFAEHIVVKKTFSCGQKAEECLAPAEAAQNYFLKTVVESSLHFYELCQSNANLRFTSLKKTIDQAHCQKIMWYQYLPLTDTARVHYQNAMERICKLRNEKRNELGLRTTPTTRSIIIPEAMTRLLNLSEDQLKKNALPYMTRTEVAYFIWSRNNL